MGHSQNGTEGESAPPFELKDIFNAVIRSWVLIVVLATLGLAGGIYKAASKSNYYTSKAKLHLRVGARENLSQEDLAGAPQVRARDFSTGIEDEIHMLTGQALFTRLAKQIGPGEILAPADPRRHVSENMSLPKRLFHELQAALAGKGGKKGTEEDSSSDMNSSSLTRATEILMRKTFVQGERFSNVISVSHTSSSKEKAQRHCQAIVDGFIERHLEQYSTVDKAEAAEGKYMEAKREFDAARTDYFAHTSECGTPGVNEALTELLTLIAARENKEFNAKGRREQIAAEIVELGRQIDEMPPTIEVERPEVTRDNPDYASAQQLRNSYVVEKDNVQFENILNETKRERIAHYERRIGELDEQLASLDSVILVKEESSELAPNPAREVLRSKIRDLKVEDSGLIEEVENLREGIEAQLGTKDQMMNCQQVHGEMLTKQMDLESAFHRYRDQYERLEAYASIDEAGQTNLQVLEPPNLPLTKSGPSRGKLVIVGLMGGAMAGVALALLRQLLDPKLRHPHNIERTLGVPVIAVVPHRRSVRALRKASHIEPAPAG